MGDMPCSACQCVVCSFSQVIPSMINLLIDPSHDRKFEPVREKTNNLGSDQV